MPDCPDREVLSDLAAGALDELEADAVTEHLAQCAGCEATLHDLESCVDPVRSLRPAGAEPFVDEPACQEAVRAVQRHAPSPAPESRVPPAAPSSILKSSPPAPAPAKAMDRAEFIAALSTYGLLTADELNAFEQRVPSAASSSAETLARSLAQHGVLTRYQAAAVFQGKAHTLVYGDYLVLEKLGAGGMGQVFKAQHRRMHRTVALKVLPSAATRSPDAVKRFEREVHAAAQLTHPNIVTAYDAGEAGGVHYLVMEFVDGQDLGRLLKSEGRLPVDRGLDYLIQAARGLAYAHQKGIVHRDIKPANLLVDKQGNVKVLDMGLARVEAASEGEAGLTRTDAVMGTADYMAPEQAQSTRLADARSDIYSLGCTMYRLLTGENPFPGETAVEKIVAHLQNPIPSLRAARPDVPAAIDSLFARLVAKKPADRPASMNEVINELEKCRGPAAPIVAALRPVPIASEPTTGGSAAATERYTGLLADPRVLVGGGMGVAVLLIVGWLLAGVMFKVKTSEGTLVLDVEPKGAAVEIDDQQQVTVIPAGGEPVRIEAAPGKHMLRVRKGGFETYTTSFSLDEGSERAVRVRLEPSKIASTRAVSPTVPGDNPPAGRGAAAPANNTVVSLPAKPSKGATTISREITSTLSLAAPSHVRRAAGWVLECGGKLDVADAAGEEYAVARAGALPAGWFSIVRIDLANCPKVDDAGLPLVAGLKDLRSLWLTRTKVTDPGLGALRGLAMLSELRLNHLNITDVGLAHVAGLTELTFLDIGEAHVTDAGIGYLTGLTKLETLGLLRTGVTDAGLSKLRALKDLKSLNLDHTRITDAGLNSLAALPKLGFLNLDSLPITDAGLALLGELPNLHTLIVCQTRISDAGLGSLAKLKSLTDLNLKQTSTSAAAVERLRIALPHCQINWSAAPVLAAAKPPATGSSKPATQSPVATPAFAATKLASDPALERRAAEWVFACGGSVELNGNTKHVRNIKELPDGPVVVRRVDLHDRPACDDAGLTHLAGLRELASLWLVGTSTTDRGLVHLRNLTSLEQLGVNKLPISDQGLAQLSGLTNLTFLDLGSTQISDAGLMYLGGMKTLGNLSLRDTGITSAGLRQLVGLRALQTLNLAHTRVDDAGMPAIAQLVELTSLNLHSLPISDWGFAQLAPLTKLRTLVGWNTRLSDAGLASLARLKNLTELDIRGTLTTGPAVDQLRATMPKCAIGWGDVTGPRMAAAPAGSLSKPETNVPAPIHKADADDLLPIPSATEQEKSLALLKEVFKDDYAAAKQPSEKKVLAEKLITAASTTTDDAASRYAMLAEARRLAIEATDVPLLDRAVDWIASQYRADTLAMLADDWQQMLHMPRTTTVNRGIAEAALAKIGEAEAAERFDMAKQLGDVALSAARRAKEPDVLKEAVERNKKIAADEQQRDAARKYAEVLQTMPDDPAANLALGRILCFSQGDWGQGFKHLALGSDTTLKGLAAKSMAGAGDAEGQVALGDAWWKASEAARGKARAELQAGAAYWYSQALPSLTGLLKTKIEKRVADAGPVASKKSAPAQALSEAKAMPASQQPAAASAGGGMIEQRSVAGWVLSKGGKLGLRFAGGGGIQVTTEAELPTTDFIVSEVNFSRVEGLADADLARLAPLAGLNIVRLTNTQVGDAGLAHLAKLPEVNTLELYGTRVTDAGVDLFANHSLVALYAGNTKVTDACLPHLPTTIVSLSLGTTGVTERGLQMLTRMPRIWWLDVHDLKLTDASVPVIASLPRLRSLYLINTLITDRGLAMLGQVHGLETLTLQGTSITDDGLKQLAGVTNLHLLGVARTKVTPEGIKWIRDKWPGCKIE